MTVSIPTDTGLKNPVETLKAVEAKLRDKTIRHVNIASWNVDNPHDMNEESLGFNMNQACRTYECGTVACIGGHAWLHENPQDFEGASSFVHEHMGGNGDETVFTELFYPSNMDSYFNITAEEAADAIKSFLETGDPNWRATDGDPD